MKTLRKISAEFVLEKFGTSIHRAFMELDNHRYNTWFDWAEYEKAASAIGITKEQIDDAARYNHEHANGVYCWPRANVLAPSPHSD